MVLIRTVGQGWTDRWTLGQRVGRLDKICCPTEKPRTTGLLGFLGRLDVNFSPLERERERKKEKRKMKQWKWKWPQCCPSVQADSESPYDGASVLDSIFVQACPTGRPAVQLDVQAETRIWIIRFLIFWIRFFCRIITILVAAIADIQSGWPQYRMYWYWMY